MSRFRVKQWHGLVQLGMSLFMGTGSAVEAGSLNVTIDAGRTQDPVTKYEYGMFIEPIGGLIARTLWAEMLDDRKFYYPVVAEGKDPPVPISVEGRPGVAYRKWRPIGGDDAVQMDSRDCYVGAHSPRVVLSGDSARGIRQAGLGLAKGKTYSGHIVLQGDPGAKVEIALIWGTGADQRRSVSLAAPGADWRSDSFEFVAGADSTDARFEVTGTGQGSFRVGAVSLMPADNINGWRADTTSILRTLHSGMWRLPRGQLSVQLGLARCTGPARPARAHV